jgi:hypothetical protein
MIAETCETPNMRFRTALLLLTSSCTLQLAIQTLRTPSVLYRPCDVHAPIGHRASTVAGTRKTNR